MSSLPLFILAVFSILATPGPTNALLTTSAALVGLRRSLRLMPAEIAGYFISIGLLVGVSGPLIAASPAFRLTLRAALIAYLIWLAWRLWRSGDVTTEANATVVTPRRVFVTTLLNPKGPIFAFGIFPVMTNVADVIVHFGTFALTTLAVATGWMVFGASLGRFADKERLSLPRVTSVVLLVFAGLVVGSVVASR